MGRVGKRKGREGEVREGKGKVRERDGRPYRSDSSTVTLRHSKLVVTFPNSTLIACVKVTTKIKKRLTQKRKNEQYTKTKSRTKNQQKNIFVRIKTAIRKVSVGEKIEL